MRYPYWHRRAGGIDRPDLRDIGKKLLGYLEDQRRLSAGVKTLTIRRTTPDGSVVIASFIGDIPKVQIIPAEHQDSDQSYVTLRAIIQGGAEDGVGNNWNYLLTVDLERYYQDGRIEPVFKVQAETPVAQNALSVLIGSTAVGNGASPQPTRNTMLQRSKEIAWLPANEGIVFYLAGFEDFTQVSIRPLVQPILGWPSLYAYGYPTQATYPARRRLYATFTGPITFVGASAGVALIALDMDDHSYSTGVAIRRFDGTSDFPTPSSGFGMLAVSEPDDSLFLFLYTATLNTGNVYALDPLTLAIKYTVAVPFDVATSNPEFGMMASLDGRTLYFVGQVDGVSQDVYAFDIASQTWSAPRTFLFASGVLGVSLHRAGRVVYLQVDETTASYLEAIDPVTLETITRVELNTDGNPNGNALSLDGLRSFSMTPPLVDAAPSAFAIEVHDTATGEQIASIPCFDGLLLRPARDQPAIAPATINGRITALVTV